MTRTQQIARFLHGHYFHAGLRCGLGVFGPALALAALWGDAHAAMAVAIGAFCASVLDQPGPLRHKRNEMLASTACGAFALVVTSLAAPWPWLLGAVVVALGFAASMLVAWGRRAAMIGFAALLMMAISVDGHVPPADVPHAVLLFLAGGVGYTLFTLALCGYRAHRGGQQALAAALIELARYVRIKARFYDPETLLENAYRALLRQQGVVAETQQVARDVVLRAGRQPHERERRLLALHGAMIDLYEYVVSAQTDYELLRRHFGGADVMLFLRDLVQELADELDAIAYAVVRDRPSRPQARQRAELPAIELALERLEQDPAADVEARMALRATFNKVRAAIGIVARLHAATDPRTPAAAGDDAPRLDFAPFLSQQGYTLAALRRHGRWQSPVLRHAVRSALALGTGFVLAELLPALSHRYWVLLTIVIILKPSFGLTRQRNLDRLIGTAAGCLAAVAVLHFVHSPALQVAIMFVCLVLGVSLLTVAYRYSAMCTCMLVLLQFNVLMPGSVAVVGERIVDTAVGSALALVFSYLLPHWEHRTLPQLAAAVLAANRGYLDAALALYLRPQDGDAAYRLARRGVHVAVANLGGAFERMLHEPRPQQHGVTWLYNFVLQNYLLASQIAGLAVFAATRAGTVDAATREHLLVPALGAARAALERAERRLGQAADAAAPSPPLQAPPSAPHALVRRLRLIGEAAAGIERGVGAFAAHG
ncbi:putative membrane protein YccC [Plasticicumulans lactativorans]|uniref:Putative membrane protein YccC n=1 Tax=Plasticicumulans lactativorans TaxID=1133106 RepID=A0A4R2L5H2_9GAMM|nr:FUSC family membrane protein [Plasticicumulans lactativorans]TCO81062.1 putative membrane protein YccC [Plasticicumulans lactativorans]